MRIAVPAESDGERRVALTPQAVRRLVADGHEIVVETGLGEASGFPDAAYAGEGAEVTSDVFVGADLILVVGPPTPGQAAGYPEGITLVGFLDPFVSMGLIRTLTDRQITSFAVEAIPRTTLAQGMDALSSQASAAGYQAVLLAAMETPRIFPMMITAAGTIPPVKLLVLGAGVAGLQAIATAKRLGAVVSAYDVRPQVREQIESLGAKFIAAPVDESAASASGYAKELTDDTQRRQQRALVSYVADADVIITTAQVPGFSAPMLISREMVEQMRPGSVIVDMAASSGGNCEITRPDENVLLGGVLVMGPTDLAGRVAIDASEMYAKNLGAFLGRISDDDGRVTHDFDDQIVGGACITHGGAVSHPVTRRKLGLEPRS